MFTKPQRAEKPTMRFATVNRFNLLALHSEAVKENNATPQAPTSFLSLPRELRDQVYEDCLHEYRRYDPVDGLTLTIKKHGKDHSEMNAEDGFYALLYTNRQVSAEVRALLEKEVAHLIEIELVVKRTRDNELRVKAKMLRHVSPVQARHLSISIPCTIRANIVHSEKFEADSLQLTIVTSQAFQDLSRLLQRCEATTHLVIQFTVPFISKSCPKIPDNIIFDGLTQVAESMPRVVRYSVRSAVDGVYASQAGVYASRANVGVGWQDTRVVRYKSDFMPEPMGEWEDLHSRSNIKPDGLLLRGGQGVRGGRGGRGDCGGRGGRGRGR